MPALLSHVTSETQTGKAMPLSQCTGVNAFKASAAGLAYVRYSVDASPDLRWPRSSYLLSGNVCHRVD